MHPDVSDVADEASNVAALPAPAVAAETADQDRARRLAAVARLYGQPATTRFWEMHVVVVGIGGVGSWAAEALARSGIGALTLVDLDHIAESNVNRQVHALDGEIGRAKVEAMGQRIASISAQCRLTLIDDFLNAENCAAIVGHADAVIDCIDDVSAKTALAAHCSRAGIHLVVCGAAGGKRDATRIRIDDLAEVRNDPLLARLRTRLRKEHGFPPGASKGRPKRFAISCVFADEAPAPAPQQCAPGAALACAGYGSVVHMTAAMGLAAVGQVLNQFAVA